MRFEDILPAFRAGGEIRRMSWSNWILLKIRRGKFLTIVDHNDEQVLSIGFENLMADDWETTRKSLVMAADTSDASLTPNNSPESSE